MASDGSFCKIFGAGKKQVLCLLTDDDEGLRCVTFYVDLNIPGLGLSAISYSYDSDEKANAAFDMVDDRRADEIRAGLLKQHYNGFGEPTIIEISGIVHRLPSGHISGEALYNLADIGNDEDLFMVGDKEDVFVECSPKLIILQNGDAFHSVPKEINGG